MDGKWNRMRVITEDDMEFNFVKGLEKASSFEVRENNRSSFRSFALTSSIYAAVGEPLEFFYGMFAQNNFKSNTAVKKIEYNYATN